jgi:hypothetical protein
VREDILVRRSLRNSLSGWFGECHLRRIAAAERLKPPQQEREALQTAQGFVAVGPVRYEEPRRPPRGGPSVARRVHGEGRYPGAALPQELTVGVFR